MARLDYLVAGHPHYESSCTVNAAIAHISNQTTWRDMCFKMPSDDMRLMHMLRSLLLSVLCFFLIGRDGQAATIPNGDSDDSAAQGSSDVYNTRFPNVTWDNAAWEVRTTNLDQGHYQSRMSIANGYLGINVAAAGPFFEQDTAVDGDNINGWPLFSQRQTFATIAGFFDQQPTTNGTNFEWLNQYGGESVISGVPHWSGLILDLGNGVYLAADVDSSTVSNFSTSLNAQKGIMSWSYTWAPSEFDVSFDIAFTMFAHKLYVNQGFVRLQITPSEDFNASIVNVIDGNSAARTDFIESGMAGTGIYTAVSPLNVGDVQAYIYSEMEGTEEIDVSTLQIVRDRVYIGANGSSIAQGASTYLKAGQTTVATKYVGAATSDGFVDPQRTAQGACALAKQNGYDTSMQSHVAEWAEVFPPDSVDNFTFPDNGTLPADQYIIEAAINAVLNVYYLLQNTVSTNAISNASFAPIDTWSISVGGLTSDSYAGLVFWDAEIWMQPGLAVSHPAAVRQIANYRVERYDQAKANAQTAVQSSKNQSSFSPDSAVFPWTSGRTGNCTGTGPCFDYEYHINGDIAQEFVNYWVASGDTQFFNESLFPIYDSIAQFYSQVVTKNGSNYTLTNMTDPDEYANGVDNGGFTMPLIIDTLINANMFRQLFGQEANATYQDIADNIFIDKNSDVGIINEYTGMNGSISVKQADVVLDTFPLNFKQDYTVEDSRRDLEYYAGKQSLEGPGMTYAIFSIVASAVDSSGCSAYTYQQYSSQPYARAPWFQFSEQLTDNFEENGGTHPAYPFLTGHGGANQVTIFGYLGLRLTPSWTLHISPSLPPQIPNLKYRTFYFHGWPISASSNQTHTTLNRLATPFETANTTFANTSIDVTIDGTDNPSPYVLPPNGTLVVPNRQTANFKTVEGNIAQCAPASSPEEFQPGQFPISATDGAASTKWQPAISNITTSLVLNLASIGFQPVRALFFDWAQNVPVKFTVLFHNSSNADDEGAVEVTRQDQVEISTPYDEAGAADVKPYASNTTNVTLETSVYTGLFATLKVQGNQADAAPNATGATVAEWAIVV